jgi:phosphoglycolate phosphatase
MKTTAAAAVAVIFDLDDTLIDSKALAMDATAETLEQSGFSDIVVDESSYAFGSRYVTPKRLAWHATGDTEDPCGPVLAIAFEKYVADLVTIENTPIYDGVIALLQHLHAKENLLLGVLSNASSSFVYNVINIHELTNTFQLTCGADDVPEPKPQPGGLNAMLLELRVPAPNSIYVGDSPTDGMAASGAHMHSIGVTWGHNCRSDLEGHFDTVVDTASQLQAAIEAFLCQREKPAAAVEQASGTEMLEERPRRVSWQNDVIDNEHMNKMKTDDEYWDGR